VEKSTRKRQKEKQLATVTGRSGHPASTWPGAANAPAMEVRWDVMEGTRVSADEVKARWAYSEIWADRWKAEYADYEPEKVRQGLAFENLSPDEKAHLLFMLMNWRGYVAPEVDKFQIYECQSWTKDQLARTYTIMQMAPDQNSNIPFLSFCICPRFNNKDDPRVQADAIPLETEFVQTEPVIVLPYDEMNLLIDGYLRSVLFMRSPNPEARILVWYPIVPPATASRIEMP